MTISSFDTKTLKELDDELCYCTSKGLFETKTILNSLRDRGFTSCYYFDAAEDQVGSDYLLILSSYHDQNMDEKIIGRSINFKTSAIGTQGSKKRIITVYAGDKQYSDESTALASELKIEGKHRTHIPLYSGNELVGAITCAWDGNKRNLDDNFLSSLELFSVLIEKHIFQSREQYVQDKVDEIRNIFKNTKKFDDLDTFLDLGVQIVQKAVNGVAASFFDLNWYSGLLIKSHEHLDPTHTSDEKLEEEYPIGEFLTGKAWEDETVRYIVDFECFRQAYHQEINEESEKYHQHTIGGVKTILYEKFGTEDRQFLIRIFNRLDNRKLPFFISQKILLKQIAREFEFLLKDIILEKKLSDIQEVSREALKNITCSRVAFDISANKLSTEWVYNILFIAIDKKTNIVTHCHSTIEDLKPYIGTPITKDGHSLFNSVLSDKPDNLLKISNIGKESWIGQLANYGISCLYSVPFDSVYKKGLLAVCIPNGHIGSAEAIKSRVPQRHTETIRSYAAIIGVCVEAEESLLTSQSAKRLIGSIGHEVQGPIALAVGAANSVLQETLELLEDLRREYSILHQDSNFDRVYNKLLDAEITIATQSEKVNTIMRLAKDVAQESKGEGTLQLHFSKYSLFDVLKDAQSEVLKTVEHIDAFDRKQRFIFSFNEACKHFPTMVGDKTLLTKVFVNLFTNAVKYSLPPGKGKAINIIVTGIPQTSQGIIQIKNFGMSIPDDDHETIFLPFERGYTKDRLKARRGMGLGLYLARKIVLGHKGTVFLERSKPTFDDQTRRDTEGWETVFEVRLPYNLQPGTYNYAT